MSAHDAIEDLPPFKIQFMPLQAIFDDFVFIFCSKLAIDEPLLSSYCLPLDPRN
jgi:hypothetical protein